MGRRRVQQGHKTERIGHHGSVCPGNAYVMSLRDIRILYLRELRSALRDRTIVTGSILIPILLYPLILWLAYAGFTFVSGQSADLKSRVMLKDVPVANALLQKQLET